MNPLPARLTPALADALGAHPRFVVVSGRGHDARLRPAPHPPFGHLLPGGEGHSENRAAP